MVIVVDAVTDLNDWNDGNCELREAVDAANNNISIDYCIHDGSSGLDEITFANTIASPSTIILENGPIHIIEPLKITGPGASKLSVTANFQTRILDVASNTEIFGLAFWKGQAKNPVAGGNSYGGAIYSSADILKIDGCMFFFNRAEGATGDTNEEGGQGRGGAIYGANSGSSIIVTNSLFMTNFAHGGDGGTPSGSSATNGGAGFGAAIFSNGPLTLENTTVSGNGSYGGDPVNTATNTGANGIATGAVDARDDLMLKHVTIFNNEAKPGTGGQFDFAIGGGVYAAGNGEVLYSIIAGNFSAFGPPDINHIDGNLHSSGHNVLGVEDILFPQVGDVFGTPGTPVDPLLDLLADNAGETRTHSLLSGSPAIDIDSNGTCLIAADQRGMTRPQGNGCDAGAFEKEVSSLPCPHPQGYWKNNPAAWPTTIITLGTQQYTQVELLPILSSATKKDASLILAKQLIAAKLNVEAGSDPAPISSTIADADALLAGYVGKLPYKAKTNSSQGQQMVQLGAILEQYNLRQLTPSCQP